MIESRCLFEMKDFERKDGSIDIPKLCEKSFQCWWPTPKEWRRNQGNNKEWIL